MIKMSIHEAKTHFSSLISNIERNGEHVIILKHGVAIAELIPIPRAKRSLTHPEIKNVVIEYDPTEPTEGEWEGV